MSAVAQSEAKGFEALLSLASFKDVHRGQTILVCGCGESLNELKEPVGATSIGVNDVGRRFTPDYLARYWGRVLCRMPSDLGIWLQ